MRGRAPDNLGYYTSYRDEEPGAAWRSSGILLLTKEYNNTKY